MILPAPTTTLEVALGRLRYFAAREDAAAVRPDVITFPSSMARGAPVDRFGLE